MQILTQSLIGVFSSIFLHLTTNLEKIVIKILLLAALIDNCD